MIKVLIAGDFCPRDRVLKRIINNDVGSILSQVKPYIKSADLAVVNFESPVVIHKADPIQKLGPSLKCPQESIDLLKQTGFGLVTLANNHFYDQGDIGVVDTINSLSLRGMDYVGGGREAQEASRIYYFKKQDKKIAIINCCEHEFSIATDKKAGSNPLNPIAQWYQIQEAKNSADSVIVIVHGGHEQYQLPSPRMKETYRFFIDAGADAVINHHQHCYSGYEVYKDKPIFYGLGNFCMDDPRYRNSKWNEGFMVMLTLSSQVSFELIPYIQGNEVEDVVLFQEEEYNQFKRRIDYFNCIISDDTKLDEMYQHWVENTSSSFLLPFMPYSNKYLRFLALKGVLPITPSKGRRLAIRNKIECESHRDKLLFILKKI